jgi:hypothetical protein
MKRFLSITLVFVLSVAFYLPALAYTDASEAARGMRMNQPYLDGQSMGMAPSFEGWKGMSPDERKAYKKVWAEFMMETLELRQKLVANQIALDTLWTQPQVDKAKIQKLADETADLWADLEKKRNKYLTDCRLQFGDLGWSCPITGTGSGSYYK